MLLPTGAEDAERRGVDRRAGRERPPGAVNTPTRVSVGSAMRSVRRQASAAGELVTTITRPSPSPGSRSSSPSGGPSWIGARISQGVDADVGPAQVDAAGDEAGGEPGPVGAEHEAAGGDDRPLEHVGVGRA